MSLSFVIYALAVAGLVSAAAALAERALEAVRRPTRWIWMAAAIGTLGISAAGLLPNRGPTVAEFTETVHPGTESAGSISLLTPLELVAPVTSAWAIARPWLPWALAGVSVLGAAFLLGGWTRLRRGRSNWGSARIGETDIRVTDDFGPAVVGVLRPEIVLPRHVLTLDAEQLSMVLRHEDEHRRAADPALLLAGAGLLCAMPWNPLMWFQFRRLRRAIELDCDARVLASGVSAARYGRLLLTMQGAPTRYALATMLQEPASFLERRLMMMKQRLEVTRPVRAFALAGTAAILVIAACETPNPTAVQVEPTGAFTVTEVTGLSVPSPELIRGVINEIETQNQSALWQYRGRVMEEVPVETDVAAVRGLVPFMHPDREVPVYQLSEANLDGIWTAPTGGVVKEGLWLPEPDREIPLAQGTIEARPFTVERVSGIASTEAPLVVVDGVITENRLADISSLDIESIELVKGAQAAEIYGSRGQNGVVVITTKTGAEAGVVEVAGVYRYREAEVFTGETRGGVIEARPTRGTATAVYEEVTVPGRRSGGDGGAVSEVITVTGRPVGGVIRRRDSGNDPAGVEPETMASVVNPDLIGSRPLIVIDGVISSLSLADINKDDVESIELIKGGAAAALYGSRARNGVVMVTTR